MPFKPMPFKTYLQHIKKANWSLKKGKIDWNLYNENDHFICCIKTAHGKKTKEEVIAASVKKTKKAFEERGLKWPPQKKG